MISYLHAIAALAVAGYLYQVNTGARAEELYTLTREDLQGFMTWGLAAAILAWVASRAGPIGDGLMTLIVVSAALTGGPKIIEGVELLIQPATAATKRTKIP